MDEVLSIDLRIFVSVPVGYENKKNQNPRSKEINNSCCHGTWWKYL